MDEIQLMERCRAAVERAEARTSFHRLAYARNERIYRDLSAQLQELELANAARRAAVLKRWKLRQDLREAREMLATADPMPIAGRAKGVRSLSRRTAAELVDHLWSRAAPLPHGCGGPGIYALFHGNELVYIGQAVNVAVRIGQHFGSKTFTAAAYISVPRDRLNQVERVLLDALVPRLNRDSSTQLRRRELSSAFQADTAMCDTLKEG